MDSGNGNSDHGAGKVNFAAAERFFTLLDPSPNALFTFQSYDDNSGRADPRLYRIIHATRAQLPNVLPRLAQLNAMGAAIGICINQTDGHGRKHENIVQCRACYIDLDDAPLLAPVLAHPRLPHIVTDTSPGRHQCFWLVENMPLADFCGAQEALLEKFGGDPGVRSIERVMRLPGFLHQKREPFLVRIHTVNERPPYRADEFEKKVQPVRVLNEDRDKQAHPLFVAAAVAVIPNPDLHHDDWNNYGMAIYAATGGSEAGFEIFDSFSRKSTKYKPRTTYKRWQGYHRSPPDRIGFGTLHYAATRADPDWQERLDQQIIETQARVNAEALALYKKCAVPTPAEQASIVGTLSAKLSARETADSATFAAPRAPGLYASEAADSVAFRGTVAPPPKPSVLHWHGETQLVNPAWLIKDVLPETGAGLLSGQWGTGKTFVAICVAGSVMTGNNFIDYRVKRPGGVLFIAKEGKAGLPLRLAVMNEHSLQRKDNVRLPFAWADIPLNLALLGPDPLITLAREAQAEMRRRFNLDLVLIIVDPMQKAAGFKTEGEGAEGTVVMDELHKLAAATNTFVLVVDHFGKDIERGTRGTMTKEDGADTIFALVGERKLSGKVSNLRMGLRKVKDGESGREIPFRLELINCGTDEDGDAVTSCIVHWEPDRRVSTGRPQSKSNAIFAAALQAALDAHGNRALFAGLVAVPEYEVRKVFITNYMDNEEASAKAARERWRNARDRAIEIETVELRSVSEVRYLCCTEAQAAF